jgi:hypothetical protein
MGGIVLVFDLVAVAMYLPFSFSPASDADEPVALCHERV